MRRPVAQAAWPSLITTIPMFPTSMNRVFRTAMVGMCLALILGAGTPVGAQNVRTLTIRDGKVLIDGQEVPKKDLPASLDVQDVEATHTIVGDLRLLFQLGDVLYVFDNQGLREARDVYVVDGQRPDRAPLLRMVAQEQAQALQQSTEELDELSRQFEQSPQPNQQEANQALKKASSQVAQAAEVVESLPQLEVQSYFSDVWRSDQGLYAKLVSEWRLEREVGVLALEIRNLREGSLRQERIAQLRQKLDAIFEFKQENRRLEIEQLERQLNGLNERLQVRENLRDQIIDQRLNQLIGTQNPPDNR